MKKDVLQVLKEIVLIPSYVEKSTPNKEGTEEIKFAEYITNFFSEHLPTFKIRKQFVDKKRYNIIASNCNLKESIIIFCCHMDTVAPSSQQLTENGLIVFEEKNDRICGLGTVDMKGGTAAILSALTQSEKILPGITLIFYCDEEYDFIGMKMLTKEILLNAKIAVFPEPTNLTIAYGCRGVIEIKGIVKGKTSHASVPKNGLNAILLSTNAFKLLETGIERFKHDFLGQSVCNLAYLEGGLEAYEDGKLVIKQAGNKVPDIAKITLECRTSMPQLNSSEFCRLYGQAIEIGGGSFTVTEITSDLGSMITNSTELKEIERALSIAGIPIVYADPNMSGYYDAQIFSEKYGIPCISLGPGPSSTAHQSDEYVSKESIEKSVLIYKKMLEVYGITKR